MLKEIFPSWFHIKTYEEVLVFTCGLLSDPRPLIEHVGEMLVERELSVARSHPDMKDIVQLRTMRKSPLLLKIMESLYSEAEAEAEVPVQGQPHHNQFFNFYVHKQDDLCKRALDVSPIEIPSQLYYFEFLRKPLPSLRNLVSRGRIARTVLFTSTVSPRQYQRVSFRRVNKSVVFSQSPTCGYSK